MTLTAAEKAVVVARRRKKRARPGYRQEAALRLKMAVTEALRAAARDDRLVWVRRERSERATSPSRRAALEAAREMVPLRSTPRVPCAQNTRRAATPAGAMLALLA
jgi:hypothetical protein